MNHLKYCSFYVSEIHLVTMLLPYMKKKMKNKNDIYVIFEKNIKESVDRVLKGMNLNEADEIMFKSINWENNDVLNTDLEGKTIFVMGTDKYIEKMNDKLQEIEGSFCIVNCFELFQAEKNIYEILKTHRKFVNTAGEEDTENYFTKFTNNSNKKITIIK